MTYPDSVRFLYALGNEIKTAKLGLERIRVVLEALGHPESACRFVHVAGTNGKGSSCAMIEAGLRSAGVRTGLFTSPHLVEPAERIRVCGQPVTTEEFTSAFRVVHEAAERLLAAGLIDAHPTYFETVTAMALHVFRETRAQMVVLETGLGGRLDATNVVSPELTVITPIDFDHEQYLGGTLSAIAGEKAGILKPGVPAVFARQRAEAAEVLEGRARELGCEVRRVADAHISEAEIGAHRSVFVLNGERIECPLAGEHQVENAAAAALALERLGMPRGGIAGTVWPGRLERVAEAPDIILDGAHNPAGARSLAAYMDRFFAGRRIWLVYGTMRDKAVEEITGILFSRASEVILTAAKYGRSLRPESIAEVAGPARYRIVAGIREALQSVRSEARAEDAIFVTGSLFVVGEARALLVQ